MPGSGKYTIAYGHRLVDREPLAVDDDLYVTRLKAADAAFVALLREHHPHLEFVRPMIQADKPSMIMPWPEIRSNDFM